jgi:hypothetical protein
MNNLSKHARNALIGAVVLTTAAVGPAFLALSSGSPRPGEPVLVITAPWTDPESVVTAAGGRVIAPASAPMATLGVFADAAALARVGGAGGWLVVDGRAAAALCGVDA